MADIIVLAIAAELHFRPAAIAEISSLGLMDTDREGSDFYAACKEKPGIGYLELFISSRFAVFP